MTRMTPERPFANFRTAPAGGCLTHDIRFTRPNTRRIFSGIVFRTWNPQAPKPKLYHSATLSLTESAGVASPKLSRILLKNLSFPLPLRG
ncbi:hypothetical protein AVEN_21297-1 [Araneus ventricosus]|uniref:Uncharacterized protein n=1 Tax=Araneus ventricosus TaxID=182803 RepID=A0A4Y2RB85_ARAVE|nr:hypothetical protein AVEN_21297-1 [Araneus ventricosus]